MPQIRRFTGGLIPSVPAGFDASTLAWVAAVVTAGGTVSATQEGYVDTLIKGLKADGFWTRLDRLWLYASENAFQAQVDLVALASHTVVNSPSFTANRGYTGVNNSTTTYIDTGWKPSTGVNFTLNTAHYSVWCVTNIAPTGAGGAITGAIDGTTQTDFYLTFGSDGRVYPRLNSGSLNFAAPATRAGHWIVDRTASNVLLSYQNGVQFSSDGINSATARPTFNQFVLADNNNGSAIAGNPNQVGMFSAGDKFSATEATSFYNRLRTYMTSVGVP